MGRLIARYLALVVAVILLNFALPRSLPGDPLEQEAGDGLTAAVSTLTAEARAEVRATYHLDRSLGGQFPGYFG